MSFDEEGFRAQMQEQKHKSKQAWQGMGEGKIKEVFRRLAKEEIKTAFLGYEEIQSESKILKLIKGDEIVPFAIEGDEIEVVAEKTPFYGESGGQIGDRGVIFHEEFSLEVENSIKPLEELIIHQAKVKRGRGERRDIGSSPGGPGAPESHRLEPYGYPCPSGCIKRSVR